MKLFAWQPSGHGQLSFFIAAENEKQARAAVDKYIDAQLSEDTMTSFGSYDVLGWGTDYYQLTELDPGQVAINSND